jgi:hypothetical protein
VICCLGCTNGGIGSSGDRGKVSKFSKKKIKILNLFFKFNQKKSADVKTTTTEKS